MSSITGTASEVAAVAHTVDLETRIREDPGSSRVLSGDRPTGPVHVGHYFGTLANLVRLQESGVEVFVLVADYQTLTDREAPRTLAEDVLGQSPTTWPSGSIRPSHDLRPQPDRSPEPAPAAVPQPGERVGAGPQPDRQGGAGGGGSRTGERLDVHLPGAPGADILFCHANVVPVGKDQLPHLELTRLIARRFNDRYAPGEPYFPRPEGLLGAAPLLLGTDGTKMSKSRGNAIALAATEDETARLLRAAKTDSRRAITYDPRQRPEISSLLLLAALCRDEPPEVVAEAVGDRGATALKQLATEAVNERLRPIRRARRELVRDPGHLRSVLAAGAERARGVAEKTLHDVRTLMHTAY